MLLYSAIFRAICFAMPFRDKWHETLQSVTAPKIRNRIFTQTGCQLLLGFGCILCNCFDATSLSRKH